MAQNVTPILMAEDSNDLLLRLQKQAALSSPRGLFGMRGRRDDAARDAAITADQLDTQRSAVAAASIAPLMGVEAASPENPTGITLDELVNRTRNAAAGGVDPVQSAGLLAGNPDFNPRLAAEQQALNAAMDLEEAQVRGGWQGLGSAVGNVRDLITLTGGGKKLLPGAERGAYRSLRAFLIKDLAAAFEAGALQKAEFDFFERIIPDDESWFSMSQAERTQALRELEFQFTQRLQDEIAASGRVADYNEYIRPGRAYDEIAYGPLPDGTVPGLPERQQTDKSFTDRVSDPDFLIKPGQSIF